MSANAMHSSASNEAYTPRDVADAARATLGTIDLDPASCALANTVIKAVAYHSLANGPGGLKSPWHGRVFCNPPGGKSAGNESTTKLWWKHGVEQWRSRRVESMVWIAFKLDFLQVTQGGDGPIPLDFPICYPRSRLAYLTSELPCATEKNPDRKPSKQQIADHAATGLCTATSPPHASAVVFLPGDDHFGDVVGFREAFAQIGVVVFDFDRLPVRS